MEVDEESLSKEPQQEDTGSNSMKDEATNADTVSEGASALVKTHTDEPMTKTISENNIVSNKQLAVQKKIEQYFHRLTQGCNRSNCSNPNCASNLLEKKISGNEAAVKAIQLLRRKAEICPLKHEVKVETPQDQGASSSTMNSATGSESNQINMQNELVSMDTSEINNATVSQQPINVFETPEEGNLPRSSGSTKIVSNFKTNQVKTKNEHTKNEKDAMKILRVKEVKYLNEVMIDDLISQCEEEAERRKTEAGNSEKQDNIKDPYLPLSRSLTEVFNNMEGVNRSFLAKPSQVDMPIDMDSINNDAGTSMDVDTIPESSSQLSKGNAIETPSMDTADSSSTQEEHLPFMNFLRSLSSTEGGEMNLLTASNSSLQRTGAIKKKAVDVKSNLNKKDSVTVIQPTVDIEMVRRFYEKLHGIETANNALVNSLDILSLDIGVQLNIMRQLKKTTVNLNVFVTIMENPSLHSPEYLESALPNFCKAMSSLPFQAQADLARWWSSYDEEHLIRMVQCLQQLLTFKVLTQKLSDEDTEQFDLHKNDVITATVKCMKILYYASLFGGNIDKERDPGGDMKSRNNRLGSLTSAMRFDGDDELDSFDKSVWNDPIGEILGVTERDSEKPLVPLEEFQNEILNDTFDVYNDFTNFMVDKVKQDQFTFMHYPFILNTVNKTTYLFYDNKIQMLSGRRMMVLQSILQGSSAVSPYLRLKIRRDHVIDDSLVRLELIANENPRDLRKQLYVEFEGEQGVDEGGVSKEFFQLVVAQIFNPDYGMFTYNKDTNLFWFNAHSFESKAQYTLIGIVLGLAIYNNCILDIKFPAVVYKKLFGRRARFQDMKHSHPDLYSGLKNLLEHDGDVENDIMVTFSVEYSDMFGTSRNFELKPNGENIPVTNENRQEYVDLYADWLLNESISEQFSAFRFGFELVVSKSPLKYMFRMEELEVLISGSQVYDFNSLESTTDYDGGFTKESQTVKDFWVVVHEMCEEDKRKLLQFTTGSDRAPVGGLSQLRLVIARNGPDSERLPTAHTCFNVILLPDYKDREKLKERLHKAITYAKGFGML